MNRAFLIVVVPAFITSFIWLAFGWGWRFAAVVTGTELAVAIAAVIYILRRQSSRPGPPAAGR